MRGRAQAYSSAAFYFILLCHFGIFLHDGAHFGLCNFGIFLHDGAHFGKCLLHIGDKLELVSRSVEILTGTRGAEICVSREIIRKESHTALKGHHNSTDGEHFKLALGESAVCALDKALDVELIERYIEVYL